MDSPSSEKKVSDLRQEAIMAINTKRKPVVSGNELLTLVECAEALQITRGQWIHSVNAEKCLAALAKLEAL